MGLRALGLKGLRALGLKGLRACGFEDLSSQTIPENLKYWCSPGHKEGRLRGPVSVWRSQKSGIGAASWGAI